MHEASRRIASFPFTAGRAVVASAQTFCAINPLPCPVSRVFTCRPMPALRLAAAPKPSAEVLAQAEAQAGAQATRKREVAARLAQINKRLEQLS